MVPTINLILLVTPGRIIDKRRDGWSSMLHLNKKWTSEANVKANRKFFYFLLLLFLLMMFMSRRCQASYFTVAQALSIVLPSISPYTFLWLVAKFVGKLETTLRIAQLLSANCELPNEVATFIRHELDSKLRDTRNTLFFLLMVQKSKPCTLIPAWERKQMLFLPSIRNF